LLYVFEFPAHRRVLDPQVRGDLLQPIPMLSARVGDPGFPMLREDLLQYLIAFSCARGNLAELCSGKQGAGSDLRDARWSESVAVGSRDFVEKVRSELRNKSTAS
jgi:hypothetical protein